MKQELKTIARRLIGRPQPESKSAALNPDKLHLIDFARQRLNMTSFADLGGVWNVDGGYSFYALGHQTTQSGVLVDTDFTPAVLERQKKFPHLKLVTKNFGDPGILRDVGKVDAIFLFDTLLHQVNPDWDVILRLYSEAARIFLFFNQQYVNLPTTTRLLDLGIEEYAKVVPHSLAEEPYKTYLRDLDAIHPQHKRPYRDIHNIWQWGITDKDLVACMEAFGYGLQFFKNCGQFGQLQGVENHAFVFSKS